MATPGPLHDGGVHPESYCLEPGHEAWVPGSLHRGLQPERVCELFVGAEEAGQGVPGPAALSGAKGYALRAL